VIAVSVATSLACSHKGDEQTENAPSTESSGGAGEKGIVIGAETMKRAGISTAAVRRSSHPVEVTLTGELVGDSERTVLIRAPIAGRLLTTDSVPWPGLGERIEAGRVLGQVSDARPLVAPRGGTVTAVNAVPGEIVSAGAPLLEISDFDHPLARVVWQADAPPHAPPSLFLAPADRPELSVRATLIGSAPEADPVSRAPAYLYRVGRAWPGARPGAAVIARFPDSRVSRSGVFVPDDAVVQWDAMAWVYVRAGKGRYVRARLSTDYPVQGGYVVLDGLADGDTIVVQGAQLLLSEEFRASSAGLSDEN
jgi:biotin carboxyl carrier protein